MFSTGKSSGVLKDSNFKNTVLLLHGDGTTGDNNQTITDSSPTVKTFSIFPTTGVGIGQGAFSPYLPNWSNYFNGSSYFTTTYTAANFDWWVGDYTIEAWIYPLGSAPFSSWAYSTTIPCLIGNMVATTTSVNWSFGIDTSGQVRLYDAAAGNLTSGLFIIGNSWNHIAMTKTSAGVTFFCNGIGSSPTAISTGSSNISNPLTIGAFGNTYINGYVSNLRIIKGTALYSGTTYNVPNSPLTAIANTKILTCQSNRFLDVLGAAIYVVNNPTVTTFSPFSPAIPYKPNIHGGSLSLPAIASTYLQSTGTNEFTVGDGKANGSGDFTIEAWVYPYSGRQDWISLTNGTQRLLLYSDGTNIAYYAGDATSGSPSAKLYCAVPITQATATSAITVGNQWSHLAVVRKHPGNITVALGTGVLQQGSGVAITNGYSASETATLILAQPYMSTTTTPYFQPGTSITLGGFVPTTTNNSTIIITAGSLTNTGLLTVTLVGTRTPTTAVIVLYMQLTGTNIPAGTYISAVNPTGTLTGVGGTGTYQVSSPNGFPTSTVTWSASSAYVLTSPAMPINGTFPILSIISANTSCTITFRLTGTLPTITTKGTITGTANFSVTKLYLNGVQLNCNPTANYTVANDGTGLSGPAYPDSLNWTSLPTATIGKDSSTLTATTTNGYITDIRISRSALYTTTFTPSTTPLSGSSSTLMLNFQNGKNYDSTGNNHLTVSSGTPNITNATSRFGTGSISLATSSIRFYNTDPIRIRNSDFTIEGWFSFTSFPTVSTLFAFDNVITNGFSAIRLDVNSSGKILLYMSSDGATWSLNGTTSAATLSTGIWYHIATVRSGSGSNNIQVYLNGVSTITATFTGSGYTAATTAYTLGAVYNSSAPTNVINGYVDEFRVTKVARYTGNFTPQFRIFSDN